MADEMVDETVDEFGVSEARIEAATLLRRLGHALVGHHVDDERMLALSAAVRPFVEELEADPPRFRAQEGREGASHFEAPPDDGALLEHFPDCVVSGRANPMGVGIEVHRRGDQAVATVTLGPAFEGAPNRSHGGIVAAIFDDVFGYLLSITREPAFTGQLTVNYRAPTPMGQELTFRAWVTGREGRKLFMAAEARSDDHLVADATGLFVTIPIDRFYEVTGR
jgi:acyl-coenzyme A thioesterase PaaI-like protein